MGKRSLPREPERLGACEVCAAGTDPRYLYAEVAVHVCEACGKAVCEAHWSADDGGCTDCTG